MFNEVRDQREVLGADYGIKWMLKKQEVRVWTGLIWLRIGTTGGLL
jgi:hypothetical protein